MRKLILLLSVLPLGAQITQIPGPSGGAGGTVTVVSSGNLTNTAIVTGGGTQTLQTPSATSTMDSSGNASFVGSVTTGNAGTVTGTYTWYGLTSGSATVSVADAAGTPANINLPIATGAANRFLTTDGGTPQQTSWGQIGLTTGVSGVLPLANGGTNCATPYAINAQTTTYQVLAADFTCSKTITVASGTFTITLVASGSQPVAGSWIQVINYGTGVVTIARSGQNINGGTGSILLQSATATLPTDAYITSDGTNYFVQSGFANAMTTAGDIVYGGTTGVPTRLAIGGATTLLHGGASAPAYSALALADTPLTTRGDLLVANSTPGLARLAIGAANTVLHGSATDPAYSNVAAGDFGSAITARTALGNATASAAAPTFSTTADVLAYQTAEIPAYVFVTGDFTTSGAGTALEAITGLTWTMPGSTALNIPFSCHLIYHQNSAAVAVAFGTQNATTGPTNYAAKGVIYTSASVFAAANVVANTATTAVSVVSGTPSAITTNWNADLDGLIEQPSGTASVFTIRVSTATQGDTVTVKRGSFCRVG